MAEILVVCTGNINRSPTVAAVLGRRLGDRHDVRQAGLTADDMSSPARMITAALRHDIDLSTHRSRLVQPDSIATADLIIGMDRSHPVGLAQVDTSAPAKTFLLHDLVTRLRARPLQAGVDLDRWLATEIRSPSEIIAPRCADVPDPIGRSRRVFRSVTKHIVELTDELADLLIATQEPRNSSGRRA